MKTQLGFYDVSVIAEGGCVFEVKKGSPFYVPVSQRLVLRGIEFWDVFENHVREELCCEDVTESTYWDVYTFKFDPDKVSCDEAELRALTFVKKHFKEVER